MAAFYSTYSSAVIFLSFVVTNFGSILQFKRSSKSLLSMKPVFMWTKALRAWSTASIFIRTVTMSVIIMPNVN